MSDLDRILKSCFLLNKKKKKKKYENMPMNYTEVFKIMIIENFHLKIVDVFIIFAQNLDCGYTRRGSSNKYPPSMFWIRNKKKMYNPLKSSF